MIHLDWAKRQASQVLQGRLLNRLINQDFDGTTAVLGDIRNLYGLSGNGLGILDGIYSDFERL